MNLSASFKEKFYYGYVMVLLGFLLMFFIYVLKSNCSSLMILPICEDFGITRTKYVVSFSIMAFAMMFGCFFVGQFITKYKLKNVTPLCLVLLAVSYVLFSRTTNITQIYIICAVQGFLFAGATTIPTNVMVNNWFGPKIKGTFMSIASLGSGAGALVLIVPFQKVIATYSWREANLCIAGIFLVLAVLIYFAAIDRPEEKGYLQRPGDPKPEELEASGSTVAFAKRGVPFKKIWLMPRFYLQFVGQILVVACAAGFTSQAVPYFVDLGMDPTAAAALYAVCLGTLMFGKFILGFIVDLIKVHRAALLAPLFFTATFVSLYLMADTPAMKNAVIWTYMIGGAISTIVPPLLTAKNYGDKEFPSIMGVTTMGGNIGQILGPLIAAIIFDISGSYQNAWLIYGVLMFIVGVSWFFSTKISKKQASEYGYDDVA